jgi:hypothetical protein
LLPAGLSRRRGGADGSSQWSPALCRTVVILLIKTVVICTIQVLLKVKLIVCGWGWGVSELGLVDGELGEVPGSGISQVQLFHVES